MDVHRPSASGNQNLEISRTESVYTLINPEFGTYTDDPSFESDTSSSESDYDTR
jgi:hypothetical protein